MIVHAKIAKLHQHLGENAFDRVLSEIGAATDEGLESFRLEVHRLEDEPKFDLIDALEVMGYAVTYHPQDELLIVSME